MINDSDSLKLNNQICVPLYLCSKELIRKYTNSLNKLDLTYTQYIVMMYLWEVDVCNVKKLGERLLLESNTLTPLLKKLEEKEFIIREKSSLDERNLEIRLTEKGRLLKEKAKDLPKEMCKFLGLSKDEIETLYKLTNKLLMNLEKER